MTSSLGNDDLKFEDVAVADMHYIQLVTTSSRHFSSMLPPLYIDPQVSFEEKVSSKCGYYRYGPESFGFDHAARELNGLPKYFTNTRLLGHMRSFMSPQLRPIKVSFPTDCTEVRLLTSVFSSDVDL